MNEITAVAARLVVEEGLEYEAAKRRAAKSLGMRTRASDLPSNEALEDAVREHLALFHADTQPAELAALREVAATWMARLAPFRPHLAGAVWRGTATRLNGVRLELYCNDSKEAEIALIDQRVDYDVASANSPRGEPIDVLVLASPCAALGEPVTLYLSVLDHDDLRGALRPDARGRTARGDLAALRALMEAAP